MEKEKCNEKIRNSVCPIKEKMEKKTLWKKKDVHTVENIIK